MRALFAAPALVLSAGALILAGCAVVDQYSDRAVVYNVQAEQAQNEALLLNIVRASMRRPMQFSTVSSITGTAVASAGAGYTLPTNVPFRPATNGATGIATFPPVPTWSFAGSMSGGPAFTIPVLDTQEFYQGILKPIPGQLYDLYLQAGYPPDLLFNLFVKKITMTVENDPSDKRAPYRMGGPFNCAEDRHQPKCEFTFDNYPSSELAIQLFQAVADYLLALGFTTEAAKPLTVAFANPQSINIRYVGAPVRNKDDNKDDNKESVQVVAPPGGSAASAPEAQPREYGFCFKPRDGANDAGCVGGPYSPELCAQTTKTFGDATEYNNYRNSPLVCDGIMTKNLIARFFPNLPNDKAAPDKAAPHKAAPDKAAPDKAAQDKAAQDRAAQDRATNLETLNKNVQESNTTIKEAAKLQTSGASKVTVIISAKFAWILYEIVCHAIAVENGKPDPNSAAIAEMENLAAQFRNFANRIVVLSFVLRSTEGMIYYVGELARRQLNPEFGARGPIFVKVGTPYGGYPKYAGDPKTHGCTIEYSDESCKFLFLIKSDAPAPNSFLSAYYSGQYYWIPAGSYDETGLSSQVIDILRQQIAVNSSAKSLPQSSVISLVGGQ